MEEIIRIRQRRNESIVLNVFSLFTVFLAYASSAADWSAIVIVISAVELAFLWWAFISRFRSYFLRAMMLTFFIWINTFYYGINTKTFVTAIPVLCSITLLILLLQVRLAQDLMFSCYILIAMVHLLVKDSFMVISSKRELLEGVVQLVALLMVILICHYIIRRRREEERDYVLLDEKNRRVEKIKDDFVANTSHELRTPIHTISGMSEILLQEDLPDHIHKEVQDIQMTGIELHSIVTDIMDYAAIESGTLNLVPRAYNITSTLNDVMNMTVFQNREKKLELIFDCDPSIPCSLYGDEMQIRRVINNLIGNAIKFTAEGGVVVSVNCRREEYGVNLIVKVKDTGIGLTPDEQDRIFQGFYQADADRNRKVEGMGLGLTISSEIICRSGGFMTVKSQAGRGSEFAFSVPQKVLDDKPCIQLTYPSLIRAIWYFDETKSVSAIRDSYIEHICNTAEYLGITMLRSSSLVELKRRIHQSQFSHILVGMEEYKEDPTYFNDLSIQIPTILICDRSDKVPRGTRMKILYKPYNAMTLAEIFNGGDILKHPAKYQKTKHFVAPEAKILVVDDNLMNLKVVEGLLRKYRIKIQACISGEEALSIIESKDFDFVFMDHMMPGMDGIECFHRIRAKQGSDYYMQVPVIALTANAISGSREMFLEEGFNDFVAKPIDNSVLEDILRKYISEEKIVYTDEEEDATEKQYGERAHATIQEPAEDDPFRQMKGIDMDTALQYLGGDLNDYAELAAVYYQTGADYIPKLHEFYEAKDWKNYATIAHTVKSTSKTIGALLLSELAFKEETAAKNEDEKIITEYHESFMKEYERVLLTLRGNPKIMRNKTEHAVAEKLIEMQEDEWKIIKAELLKSFDSFEAAPLEEAMKAYAGYSLYGKPFSEVLKGVAQTAEEFDFEEAARQLERIGGVR